MAEDIGEVFGGFEGEASVFTGSRWVVRFACIGFVGGNLVSNEFVERGGGVVDICQRLLRRRR